MKFKINHDIRVTTDCNKLRGDEMQEYIGVMGQVKRVYATKRTGVVCVCDLIGANFKSTFHIREELLEGTK